MQDDETLGPGPGEMDLTEKDLAVDKTETPQGVTNEQDKQREADTGAEKPLLESWLKEYQKTNVVAPMAPVATDTRIGAAIVDSIIKGESTWSDVLSSQLSEEQLAQVGEVTSKAHAAHSVPFITEGYQERLDEEQLALMRTSTEQYVKLGMPTETRAYKVDPELGIAIINDEAFLNGWRSIKDRVFMAVLEFMDNITQIQLELPRTEVVGPNGEPSTLTTQNAERLDNFFSGNKSRVLAEGLAKMYRAAADSIYSDEGRKLVGQQRREYDIAKGGSPGFRETPSLIGLINLVDARATDAMGDLQEAQIPELAKDRLVDVITRRKDQPTS